LESVLDASGAGAAQELIVAQPSYFTAAAKLVEAVPLATWRAWLKWKVVHHYASLLNKTLADEDFAFYGTTLRGIPQNRPRWKRAVAAVERSLGEAVGKLYVAKHFPPAAKSRMDEMVQNVIEAYRQAILNLEWMSPQPKRRRWPSLPPSIRRSVIRNGGATTPHCGSRATIWWATCSGRRRSSGIANSANWASRWIATSGS